MYATIAQVVPVLLLALAFESRALERIRNRTSAEEDHVKFWKSSKVRSIGMCASSATD